jgi:hypothetical protein
MTLEEIQQAEGAHREDQPHLSGAAHDPNLVPASPPEPDS